MANDAITLQLPAATALALFVLGGFLFIAAKRLWRGTLFGKPTEHRVGAHMANTRAVVVEWSNGEGYVSADGELWRAVSATPLKKGDAVTVTRVDGLKLEVKKA